MNRTYLRFGLIIFYLNVFITVCIRSEAFAQTRAVMEWTHSLNAMNDAQKASDSKGWHRNAQKLFEIGRGLFPIGDGHREYAALNLIESAVSTQQSDQDIATFDKLVQQEMVGPEDGATFLTETYSDISFLYWSLNRRDRAENYARRALQVATTRNGPRDMCAAAPLAILAGEAYRHFRKREGDTYFGQYEAAISAADCPYPPTSIGAVMGVDALVEPLMAMSPDSSTVRRALDLAVKAASIGNALSGTSNGEFFNGILLTTHYLQLPRPKRDITKAFSFALASVPSTIQALHGDSRVMRLPLEIMKQAAEADGDSNAVSQIVSLERSFVPSDRHGVDSEPSQFGWINRPVEASALDAWKKGRETLPSSSPVRLQLAEIYLLAAKSARADPFAIRQGFDDAMKDASVVSVDHPLDALNFEFNAAVILASMDGQEANYERATKLRAGADALYGSQHPCMAKYYFLEAAAAYGLRQKEKADKLFDTGMNIYGGGRCVASGRADSLALLGAMFVLGPQMAVAADPGTRTQTFISLGESLIDDPNIVDAHESAEAALKIDGLGAAAFAANRGDIAAVSRALDVVVEEMKKPGAAEAEQESCGSLLLIIRQAQPDKYDEMASILHCPVSSHE